MEFLLLSRRRSSARNVPSGEERGETDVFEGYPEWFWKVFVLILLTVPFTFSKPLHAGRLTRFSRTGKYIIYVSG